MQEAALKQDYDKYSLIFKHFNESLVAGYKGFLEANREEILNIDGEGYVRKWDEFDSEYAA